MDCSMPGFPVHPISQNLLKLMSIELVMPYNHLVFCCPLYLLPSIFPSIRVFSNDLALCIRWPKCWSFSFSISPSNEYSGLISFRIDWFDLLAVQGAPKRLLQHHSSKASFLWCSTFFMVQLSLPYMTIGKAIALTRWTSVGKVMSLLFNIHFRFVITFLSRSKHLLISWLQSPSAVILESKGKKNLSLIPWYILNIKYILNIYLAKVLNDWCYIPFMHHIRRHVTLDSFIIGIPEFDHLGKVMCCRSFLF